MLEHVIEFKRKFISNIMVDNDKIFVKYRGNGLKFHIRNFDHLNLIITSNEKAIRSGKYTFLRK